MEQLLVFNYFHICPQARGIGERWLQAIILPHYQGKSYKAKYVKSSHSKVFSLYARLGQMIGTYTCPSNNGQYMRQGKLFRIPLTPG